MKDPISKDDKKYEIWRPEPKALVLYGPRGEVIVKKKNIMGFKNEKFYAS